MAEAERRIRKEEDIDELLKNITALKIVTGKWVLYDKDYLKRNALAESELIKKVYGEKKAEQTEVYNNIISTLTSVVEVVRCKDCKHYVSDGGAIMYCEHTDIPTATSDYCSYGEREEEE